MLHQDGYVKVSSARGKSSANLQESVFSACIQDSAL